MCFSYVRACAHDAKIDRKSFRTRFPTESRDGSPSKAAFFELRSLNMVLRGLSGASLGALERLLGRSWALLGRSWALLGRSWSHAGPILQKNIEKIKKKHFFGCQLGRQNGAKIMKNRC